MQKTFGDIVGLPLEVSIAAHPGDMVECTDGVLLPHREVHYDIEGGAHSNKESCFDAEVQIVTDFLNDADKWACEYATDNTDYACIYSHIIDEDHINWKDKVVEWVCDKGYPEEVGEYVWEQLDSFDAEPEYTVSDYAAYSGAGCCIGQFETGEIEEQLDINCFPTLRALHEKGKLDDILDKVNPDCYVIRYKRENPTLEFCTCPGGQWMFVVPPSRMFELIEEIT